MNLKNYLDKTGTLYFLVKIKAFLAGNYVAKDGDKVLSTNDYTTAEKNKLAGIEVGATRNDIDSALSGSSTNAVQNKVIDAALQGKQDTLTAGSHIDITNNVVSATGLLEIDDTTVSNSKVWSSNKTSSELANKQDELTEGDRISIVNNVISATSEIDDSISSDSSVYSSSKVDTLLGAKQDTLTPGTGIDITGDVISVVGGVDIDDTTTSSSTTWSSNKINTELETKQNTLTAGTRVTITNEDVINVSSEINDNATTSSNTWSADKINSVIAALNSLSLAVVQTLPTTDISTTTIYLVPKSSSQTSNVYDEYVYYNNAWEKIGDTEVDLSGYVRESDLVAITNQEIDAMFT